MMYRLRTLGGLTLEREGAPLHRFGAQRKTLALLALLAASGRYGISRERVAAYLWPESDTEHARGALKQLLHVARRQLGSPEAILGTSELRLNPSCIESDIDAFLTALDEDELELAVSQYSGPFLDGFHLSGTAEFEEWVSVQRQELARRNASALERLARAAEDDGDPAAAVEWLRRMQAVDPLSARTTLRLMRALDAAGERVAALHCAQVHGALLRAELDSAPDPDVTALAARLRAEGSRNEAPENFPLASESADLHGAASVPAVPGDSRDVDPPASGGAKRLRRIAVASAAIAVIAVAAVLLTVGRRSQGDASASAGESVAVFPFSNVSGDEAIDHVAAGLTDELSSALRRLDPVRVAPQPAVLAFQGRGLAATVIAESLGVAAVVQGSVDRVGDRLRVRAQVIRAHDRDTLWTRSYDRRTDELIALQSELAAGVVGALYPRPPALAHPGTAVPGTTDNVAYDLYLRGRNAWRQRTGDGIRQAIVFFEGAIERDPAFAMAYAGLAATYVNCSNFAYCDVREGLARAEVAADRALALDSALAEGQAAKGFVLASRLEFDGAETAFQQAINLNRSLTWAHHYYTLLLLMLGRTDDALGQNRRALTVDPLSLPANATRGIIMLQRGDLPAGDRELQRALALSPRFQLTLYYLGATRAARGQFRDAEDLLDRAAVESPGFTGVQGARAFVYRQTGRQHAADSVLAELESEARAGNPRSRMNLALAHAVLGNLDAAFALLDRSEWDVPSLISLRADPLLHSLRTDSRYRILLRRIGADP